MTSSHFKSAIAHHLKSERKKQGLSLDAASKLTGVSKAMLGQIEREESSPTISTLWKIASGLNTSFSSFFSHDLTLQSSEPSFPDDSRVKVKAVFPYSSDSGIEVFEVTLTNHHQQVSPPHSIGVIEHVIVLNGELKVYFDNDWHHLKPNDKVRFYADQLHRYEAVTETVTFQNIVCYPRQSPV
ncbi:helix-turn-helix domain-containing protein [Marinomonas mediterranea]|jgi:Predicted transcriptional regulators|uniref:Helix-turn-helix domain protein n=1 Tax=Marinomonas mediterranea (strain ATCC 700492 / JCM 21426 / NBRC 103028 / MMB-1) TaxID=717774 RepID=F2JYF9_MARM1|nr:XRE family transcriptional regulator [Marinomonas mediterranea]ADZ93088.1 helix-turn-helix domain protein [Marinomonas mediterranea MMB-1]WCN15056.1 helix-turn-helix domain-containing protein [Marinomonas mediterranea]WCN19100.1 helix-turn-helix domain-containing protein [Marinomonas mediterranea MMB-1]